MDPATDDQVTGVEDDMFSHLTLRPATLEETIFGELAESVRVGALAKEVYNDESCFDDYEQRTQQARELAGDTRRNWVLASETDVITFLGTQQIKTILKTGSGSVRSGWMYKVSDMLTYQQARWQQGYLTEALKRLQYLTLHQSGMPERPARFERDTDGGRRLPPGEILAACTHINLGKSWVRSPQDTSAGMMPHDDHNEILTWSFSSCPAIPTADRTMQAVFIPSEAVPQVCRRLSEYARQELAERSIPQDTTVIIPDPEELAFQERLFSFQREQNNDPQLNRTIIRGVHFVPINEDPPAHTTAGTEIGLEHPLILFNEDQSVIFVDSLQVQHSHRVTAANLPEILTCLKEYTEENMDFPLTEIRARHVKDEDLKSAWLSLGATSEVRRLRDKPCFVLGYRGNPDVDGAEFVLDGAQPWVAGSVS